MACTKFIEKSRSDLIHQKGVERAKQPMYRTPILPSSEAEACGACDARAKAVTRRRAMGADLWLERDKAKLDVGEIG